MSEANAAMAEENGDKVASLEVDGMRAFSPSRRPSYQPWTRTSTGLQRMSSSESLLRRPRSRQFSQTSIDTSSILLPPRKTGDSPQDLEDSQTQWHSVSLLFVALPALAGMFFENGSALMTDILMLGLGCLFLYWSVKWPWQWYHTTQEMKLADVDSEAEFAIVEESEDEGAGKSAQDKEENTAEKPEIIDERVDAPGQYPSRSQVKRGEAVKALHTLELMALSSCFLSPAIVAYVLHAIRPYLSRPSGGVVSNSNLTLFVLAAELRPILHFFRLVEERTLYLQRVVNSLPASDEKRLEVRLEDLIRRVEENEKISTTRPSPGSPAEKRAGSDPDLERSVRQSLQPQLDALNRAVRRYEKRATTQAIVTEARLQELEARLKDALTLAAAASRNSQKNGVVDSLLEVMMNLLMAPFEAVSVLSLMPFQLAGDVWRFLFGPRRKKKKTSSARSTSSSGFRGKTRIEAR